MCPDRFKKLVQIKRLFTKYEKYMSFQIIPYYIIHQ